LAGSGFTAVVRFDIDPLTLHMKYSIRRLLTWGITFIGLFLGAFLISELPVLAQSSIFTFGSAQVEDVFRDHLKGIPSDQVPGLTRHFLKLCHKHRFEPAYVLSLIQVESNFRVHVVSPAGAIGLMQIMPQTASHLAKKYAIPYRGRDSLKDPFLNLTLGITYLKELRTKYEGKSPYFHLAAYNMGPARLDQLSARPGFKPSQTLKYFENVMKGVDYWRNYTTKSDPV
jgi:hypothetical protein